MGSDATQAALRCYGDIKRIGVVTPYWPPGDEMVRTYFEECGFEVVRLRGLKAKSPELIAHITEDELREALIGVDGPDVDAIVYCGGVDTRWTLPKAERVIAGSPEMSGALAASQVVQASNVIGVTNQQGATHLQSVVY